MYRFWQSCEKIDVKSLTSDSLSNINYIDRYLDTKVRGYRRAISSFWYRRHSHIHTCKHACMYTRI